MKQSHKMKAMLAYESTPERKAEAFAEDMERLNNDPDYLPGVPLDPSLHALVRSQQAAHVAAAKATIASQVADERAEEMDDKVRKAVTEKHCNGDKGCMFTVSGSPEVAMVHVVRPERAKDRTKTELRERLPDGMPDALKDMLVAKMVGEDTEEGDAPSKDKTPMRFH